MCVQKVSEAEAMVYGGVRDVLVTNEIVGRQKLQRLTALAHNARIGVCVDDAGQVSALDAAARDAGITLPVYVEVNMGGNRCGVEPGEPALGLARQIAEAPHLAFGGLQAYHGSAQHLRGWEERRQAIAQAAEKAGRTRDLLERNGIECPTVTGAGTGSFEFEAASGVYTELQCGSSASTCSPEPGPGRHASAARRMAVHCRPTRRSISASRSGSSCPVLARSRSAST